TGAFGDVAQAQDVEREPLDHGAAYTCVDEYEAAIGADRDATLRIGHGSLRRRSATEGAQTLRQRRVPTLGEEREHGPADQRFTRVAKQSLNGAVDHPDRELLVERDDAVGGSVEDDGK